LSKTKVDHKGFEILAKALEHIPTLTSLKLNFGKTAIKDDSPMEVLSNSLLAMVNLK